MTHIESKENVEFFNSQSSFGSSSVLSNSRVFDLTQQLIDESQTIFYSLSETLIPREDLVKWIEVQHIIHRANIMVKQTIPANLNLLRRSNGSHEGVQQINKNQQRLKQLLQNYKQYQEKNMVYETFYDLYGKKSKNFDKKLPFLEVSVQPDIVQVVNDASGRKLQGVMKPSTPLSVRQNQIYKEKEIEEMRMEINRLKKKNKQLAKQSENQILKLKIQSQQRVSRIIKMMKNQDRSQQIEVLKKQIERVQIELQKLHIYSMSVNSQKEKTGEQIRDLKYENKILREELESYRRISNSRVSNDQLDHSIMSENEGGVASDTRKLQKMVKNLTYQKNLLRSQLNKHRDQIYKHEKREHIQNQNAIYHLKKQLEQKNGQIFKMKKNIDEYRAENVLLKNQNKNFQKMLQISQQSEKDHSMYERVGKQLQSQFYDTKADMNATKFSSHHYSGDGNQGYPYYQLLARQFKIRYRRSCLREKELLHKANGLQVGVISEFQQPNQVIVVLHLSNFGDQQMIKNLKMRITTAKNNKIHMSQSSIQALQPNQQIKCPVYAYLRHYPIGSTVLLCEYQYYGKTEQVRILLPVHIFKTLSVRARDGQFLQPKTESVILERKVAKDIKSLREYFRNAKLDKDNVLKSCLQHKQSETKLLLDISQIAGGFQLKYELRTGDEYIGEYIIKTLMFLLRKQA